MLSSMDIMSAEESADAAAGAKQNADKTIKLTHFFMTFLQNERLNNRSQRGQSMKNL